MPVSAHGRFARIACVALPLLAGLSEHAAAAPLALDGDEGIDRLAALVTAYKDVTRVRWVVEANDPDERARILAGLAERLGPGRVNLLERISAVGPVATRSVAPDPSTPAGSSPFATARIAVAPPPEKACSWRVTVADPAAPAAPDEAVVIPLERGDVIPTSPAATIEVGFSGPLQSTLYAFAETSPGSVRDLAATPEIAIPVEPAAVETLVLVRARRPVPFLDGIRTALDDRGGGRADLGRNAALGERFRNGGRGIGANIQLVDPGMIVAQVEPKADPKPKSRPDEQQIARADDLVETCLYTVTRLPQ